MDRTEKIDAIIDFLAENEIGIIEIVHLGNVIVEADFVLDKEQSEFKYNELVEMGLTKEDIQEFNKFLEDNQLMMIDTYSINGVSFENMEYYMENLRDSNLWIDEEEEEEDI